MREVDSPAGEADSLVAPLGFCGVSFCWPWIAHGGQWPIVKSCAHENFPGRSEGFGNLRAMMFQRLLLFSGCGCGENPLAPTAVCIRYILVLLVVP